MNVAVAEQPINKTVISPPKTNVIPFSRSLVPKGSWIWEYIDLVLPLTEAPLQYHVATGLSIVASALGRNVWRDMGASKLFPNLFLIVIGESGIMRKSTAIGFAQKFISELDNVKILGSYMSLEAFLDAFRVFPNRLVIYDELKTLTDNNNKKYGAGLITQLTSFYNCRDEERIELKSIPEEDRTIKNPCLNMLGATTADWMEVKESDIEGGFFGRILPICAERPKRSIPLPPRMDEVKYKKLISELKGIATITGEMTFTDKAERLYIHLYDGIRREYEKEENKAFLSVFYSRLGINLLKLSMIFQIVTNRSLKIEMETVQKAFACMQQFKEFYKMLINEIPLSWSHRQEQKILGIISGAEHKQMRHSEVLKRSHLSKKQFDPLIATLKEKELLESKQEGNGTTYYLRWSI